MHGSGKTPGLPFAKRSVQPAVRVLFRWERIFVFMLKPWKPAPHRGKAARKCQRMRSRRDQIQLPPGRRLQRRQAFRYTTGYV